MTGARIAVAASFALLGSARALDLSDLDLSARVWAAPEVSRSNQGSPFDVARHLAGRCHVVFVTAHEQYAVRAFESAAVDYLL